MLKRLFAKGVFRLVNNTQSEWTLKRKYPRLLFYPHMVLEEYSLFKTLCKNKNAFIEYGSGGSTIYLLKEGKRVFSVESNPEFYRYMNTIGLIRKANGKTLHFSFVDLGANSRWGKPSTMEKRADWHKYYTGVWENINPQKIKIDAIFVDGRFRVCCILYSILKVIEHGWKDTVFIIHDFWNRKQYHVVLKFLNERKSVATLGSFVVKDNVDTREIKNLIARYQATAE